MEAAILRWETQKSSALSSAPDSRREGAVAAVIRVKRRALKWKSVLLDSVVWTGRRDRDQTSEWAGHAKVSVGSGELICGRRTQEMQYTISSAFASTVFTSFYPQSTISIVLHVLSQDGALLAACLNAATLALIDAGIPMKDYVAACTTGSTAAYASNEEEADPLLDLNGLEEQELPFLTVGTSGGDDKVNVLIMESRVQMARLQAMLSVGLDGCKQIRQLLDKIVREHGKKLLKSK